MEACSSFFLPRLIGYSHATRLVTCGEVLPASDPAYNGLFTEIVDGGADEVRKRAYHFAEMISEKTSIVGGYVSRSLMWHGADTAEGAHLLDSRALCSLFESTDKKEGVSCPVPSKHVSTIAGGGRVFGQEEMLAVHPSTKKHCLQ